MAMTADEAARAVRGFIAAQDAADKAAWLGFFADDAVDEVGVDRFVGREQIGANWDSFQSLGLRLWCEEPVVVTGSEAIAIVRARVAGRDQELRIVDQFVFGDDGKIVSRRHRAARIQ